MTQSSPNPSDERIVDTMIQLARVAKLHRMIVAGANSAEILVELHRRGYLRVTTTKICREPCRQFDVALVAGGSTRSKRSKTRSIGWRTTWALPASWSFG
jgi:hypothetical protein